MEKRAPIRWKNHETNKRPTKAFLAELFAASEAEVRPDTRASAEGNGQWYIVRTVPGQESSVQGHMVGKGWGTYLPEKKLGDAVFSGYLFAWIKNIDLDAPKIALAEGAVGVMRHASSESYATLGVDEFGVDWITKIRQIEEYERAEIAWEFDRNRKAIVQRKPQKRACGSLARKKKLKKRA
jgi:hypothetical protein